MGRVIPCLHERGMFQAEEHFIHEHPGLTLIYEPITATLSDGSRYTPDFWCPQLNSYIEIAANRQSREQDKLKISLFRAEYGPVLVLSPDGTAPEANETADHIDTKKEWLSFSEAASILCTNYYQFHAWIKRHPEFLCAMKCQGHPNKMKWNVSTDRWDDIKSDWKAFLEKGRPRKPRSSDPGRWVNLLCSKCGKPRCVHRGVVERRKGSISEYRCWSCRTGGRQDKKKHKLLPQEMKES